MGPVDARKLSLEDWEALCIHCQVQRDLACEQQRVNWLDITARLQAAIYKCDIRAELAEMIQIGRVEVWQEYTAWKTEQERLALEQEHT